MFADDFPRRLARFLEESDLSRAELARRLDVHPLTVERWLQAMARPDAQHLLALRDLADSLGLGQFFTAQVLTAPSEPSQSHTAPTPGSGGKGPCR